MILRITFLFSFLLFLLPETASAALAPAVAVSVETPAATDLSRKAMEAKLGRKLKFTERIALGIARKQVKKQRTAAAPGGQLDTVSLLAGIFGILTLPLLFLGAAGALTALAALILGIIGLGRTREDGFRNGKGFAITGVVIGGLYFLLLLLVIGLIALAFND
jgi:hypothetical protein